ncbi:MAG TPA: peptidoglycan-binding domain-containing protein [Candidatus Acidoferrales bacterium]|nr:peptidoglycan-binding domain-containing protein [Candidatus Acidoferrales bacterium]
MRISGISDRKTLARLLRAGEVADALAADSAEAEAIEALQRILFYLGYGEELQWARLGADGRYEAHTVAAVAAFAAREGLAGDGSETTPQQLRLMLERYDARVESDVASLRAIQQSGRSEAALRRQSDDTESVRALQRILYVVGYGDEMKWEKFGDDGDYGANTARAVAAFASDMNFAGDGSAVSPEILAKIVEAVSDEHERPQPLPAERLVVTASSISVHTRSGRQKIASRARYGSRSGWRVAGEMPFASYVETHPEVFARQPPSMLRVLHAVVENEGSFDAVNAYDNAFLSFGILQWTAGAGCAKGELAGFLDHLRIRHPAVFEKHFGAFGLEPAALTGGVGSPACGHLCLHGQRLDSPEKKLCLRGAEWVYRFWRAGRDPIVQRAQVDYASARLGIFYRNPGKRIFGRFVADYVTSELGVALLFDQHVNRPGHVPATVAQAVRELNRELGAPESWDDDAERRLLEHYLELRHKTSMTDSKKRARRILSLAGTVLSPQRGSFALSPLPRAG